MIIFFFLAAALAAAITPGIILIYKRFGWVDDPETHTHAKVTHREAIPRGGGLVIFLSVILAAGLLLSFDKYILAILAGGLLLTIIGVIDDIYDINPKIRLVTGVLAALVIVGVGVGIPYVTNPFGPGVIDLSHPRITFSLLGSMMTIWLIPDIFAVLFILWNMNIVNWSKGVDGQMPGFVAIASAFIGLVALQFGTDPSQLQIAQFAFIVSGAFAGFLLWNFYPQRILPGYGAGSLAGYFLAILAILSGAKVATTVMVLAIPTADAVFTITRRILAGKSPLWGDRGHLHHKLLDQFGWGRRRIAVFYWLVSFSLGVLSLVLNTQGKIIAIVVASLSVFACLIWAKMRYNQQQLHHRLHR